MNWEIDFRQPFFMASDALAVGALRALQEASIPVPDRVSLISFNDTSIAKHVYPPLSTVTVYTEEMGETGYSQSLTRPFKEEIQVFQLCILWPLVLPSVKAHVKKL